MRNISALILFVTIISFTSVNAQTESGSSKDIDCPCMLEYDFNNDVKESLNADENFHPVIKFKSAEIKDGMMICNYEKVFYKLNNSSGFEFINSETLKNKWINNVPAVINYYNTQNFNSSILNYVYGDILSAQFDENFKSFSLHDTSDVSLSLKTSGSVKLNEKQNGFTVTRNDVIEIKSFAPASSVPTQLGKKKNNTIPKKK